MHWGAHLPENVAHPALIRQLLEQALAYDPSNPLLHEKLAYYHLDRFDFRSATVHLEQAIETHDHVRKQLARCYNVLARPIDALHLLSDDSGPIFERGLALMKIGDDEAAEREFRSVLEDDPGHMAACRKLCRLLRKAGRVADLVEICDTLAARGSNHAQLFYDWGWALALAGDLRRARRLLFEPQLVTQLDLPAPQGFHDTRAFNGDIAETILTNAHQISDFPKEEANRGSKRIDNLFTCGRSDLIQSLLRLIQAAVTRYTAPSREGFDPWPAARPTVARLRPWGLLQRGGDYEAQHLHPSGWLSGVYYVRIPKCVTGGDGGRGCIEFGAPEGLGPEAKDAAPTKRYVPREGMLLLAPSHYAHRTIPSRVEEDRISLAFDVVSDR